ncbi:aspartic protease [Lithospermum erythrorhizon]|uniref:Aspartic protease n=1 Tax=Lithospermum erythrorhizon TaxID=34254 RepID=A0AAV3RRS4_LITER
MKILMGFGWFWVAFMVVVCDEGGGGRMRLSLERVLPTSDDGMKLSELREFDRSRHARRLQQQSFAGSVSGVVDFDVAGTYDPFSVGLYFTKVLLGSPPKEFYVQIDTGSDVLWVTCASCAGCPTSSGLQIQLEFFDPSSSSTASAISCSDQRCALGAQSSDSGCSSQNQCSYRFQYGDGSGTSGFYLSDQMHFDTVLGNTLFSNSSAQVVFGCSTSQTGDLTKSDRAVDGIFGFGQQGLSVISQLSSQGVTPNVFSHCLKGSGSGGGILVLGEIMNPDIVYTPLVPSQPHYNVNLQSISVNGQPLPIRESVFSTSNNRGTVIDSGTTLAYLAQEAYQPLLDQVTQMVSPYARSFASKGNPCYEVTSSISEIFPTIELNFAGGASMVLKPEDYLLRQPSGDGSNYWCIGFQKIQGQGITILGDLVLKDKIVVYDVANQRIGWANYDCSQPVNVSATTNTGRSEFVNPGLMGNAASSQHEFSHWIACCIFAFLLHLSVSSHCCFSFL